ncbi:hypothetical protein [Fibrella forsythiae]|uniref:Helix-turn-helix domain-containing protein n=1 Tax=Fibrella forsythiae TaxID=2817061 RepID=A0ABS3JNK1_9BACT|nr:hypothetical protein [Fibrella forsythiae]MBO0951578.1 hypothetical protein [Fibrella forsythiae]
MTEKQVAEATDLKKDGCSIREIAGMMGLPKSTIERALKDTPGSVSVGELPSLAEGGSIDKEVQLEALRLNHELKMEELAIRREQTTQQTKELSIRQQEVENERTTLVLQTKQLEQDEQAEQTRIEGRKSLLVNKFNRLVQELLDNCKESTWEGEEVNEYLVRVDALKDKLIVFCDRHQIDEEELHIWHSLQALLTFWEKAKEDLTGWFSDDVELDLSKEEILNIKSWFVEFFDDQVTEVSGEESEEEDDAEEDQEEDDEERPKGRSRR